MYSCFSVFYYIHLSSSEQQETDGSASLLPPPEPLAGPPEHFDGNPWFCEAFLTSCSLLISCQPRAFTSEATRVGVTIAHHYPPWGMGATNGCMRFFQCLCSQVTCSLWPWIPPEHGCRRAAKIASGERSGRDFAPKVEWLAPLHLRPQLKPPPG